MGFRAFLLLSLLVCAPATLSAQDGVWFKFNKAFIQAHYPADGAFGAIEAEGWKLGPDHNKSPKCGGNDAEFHIGAFDKQLTYTGDDLPIATTVHKPKPGWGAVMEPANVLGTTIRAWLSKTGVQGKPAKFFGYLRVWNEGHYSDPKPAASNPNHVFEVHPAWVIDVENDSRDFAARTFAMTGFRGYGAAKFVPLFQSLAEGEWLHAYQDEEWLYIDLPKYSNFYQLPVRIRTVRVFPGGRELKVDVYSDVKFSNLRYENLRAIVADESVVDTSLAPGTKTFLLGLFSVNLRIAMDASDGVDFEDDLHVPQALEFFVFGRAKHQAVTTCS